LPQYLWKYSASSRWDWKVDEGRLRTL